MGEQFLDTTKQKVSYIEKHHTVGDAKSVVEFQEQFSTARKFGCLCQTTFFPFRYGVNGAYGSYSEWKKKSEPVGEQFLDTTKKKCPI